MKAHQTNAMYIGNALQKHQKVEKVLYPGLQSDKYHDILKKQAKGYGAMMCLLLKADKRKHS